MFAVLGLYLEILVRLLCQAVRAAGGVWRINHQAWGISGGTEIGSSGRGGANEGLVSVTGCPGHGTLLEGSAA